MVFQTEDPKLEKRMKIFNAAISVIAKNGYHAATIQDIANDAGLAAGTIYNYFKNKEDMVFSLLFELVESLNAASEEKITESMTSEVKLITKLKELINLVKDNPEVVRLTFVEMEHFLFMGETSRERLLEIYDQVYEKFEVLLREGKENGELKIEEDSQAIANFILGALHGFFVKNMLVEQHLTDEKIDTFLKLILKIIKS